MFGKLFDSAKNMATSNFEAVKDKAQIFINNHWSEIETYVIPALLKISEDHLNDTEKLTSAFESAHAVLPLPLRLAIKRETFVSFCLSKQADLLVKITEYKQKGMENKLVVNAPTEETKENITL